MRRPGPESFALRRSVVAAFMADEPDAADVQHAYLRFSWSRRRPFRGLPLLRWFAAGTAVGIGVASAATLVPTIRMPFQSVSVIASPSSPATARQQRARPLHLGLPTDAAEKVSESSESDPPQSLAAESPPRGGQALRSASRTAESDWQRAAQALRDGDLPLAEGALRRLEKSPDVRDRQAAELARAQLLVRHGKGVEARPILERLMRDGHTEIIRSQAATVLNQLADK